MNAIELSDQKSFLEKMGKPLREKLRLAEHLPIGAKTVLDVGCADGTLTLAMAKIFPNTKFLGIDLSNDFIQLATDKVENNQNVRFERIYLRELLERPERYDAIVFCSVLHEFFTYGEGLSSVLKALADAHELLNPGGTILIRDMILDDSAKKSDYRCAEILKKVHISKTSKQLSDFEQIFGKINTVADLNHFLLKYMYEENWDRESHENYVPVTFQKYESIFELLDMKLEFKDSYTIDFLRNKWKNDFGLTDEELAQFKSTGILIAKKYEK